MHPLIVSVALLGLAVALSSPTSVLAVLVLLGMPSGLRRSYAFVAGWIAMIALIGLMIVIFPALDFDTSRTAPSRAASTIELLTGCFLVGGAAALHRRPATEEPRKDPMPTWLVRLVGKHWAVALAAGGVMLTYSLTIVAMLEILKANVNTLDRGVAVSIFALTSIITIGAPIVYATIAPDRTAARLDDWKQWLVGHSHAIGVTLLGGVGAAIAVKAIYDLAA
jgi:hypothetical protein